MPYNEEQIIATAKNMPSQLPPDVSWNLTYCAFDDNRFFCEWEAPSKDAVEQVFKSTQVPYDAVYPVRIPDSRRKQSRIPGIASDPLSQWLLPK